MLTHTHIQMHTHRQTQTHTDTLTHTQRHKDTQTHTDAHTQTHRHTQMHTHTDARTDTFTRHTDAHRHTHTDRHPDRHLHTAHRHGTQTQRDGLWAEPLLQSHGQDPCLFSAVSWGGFSSQPQASCRESHHGRCVPLFPAGACLSGSSVTGLERAHLVRPGPPRVLPLLLWNRTPSRYRSPCTHRSHLHSGDSMEDGSRCNTVSFTSQGTSLVAWRLGSVLPLQGAQVRSFVKELRSRLRWGPPKMSFHKMVNSSRPGTRDPPGGLLLPLVSLRGSAGTLLTNLTAHREFLLEPEMHQNSSKNSMCFLRRRQFPWF